MSNPNMGNTDKKKSKKFTRKIRIRLADPNIPDSYICEIFDSSLENEDEFAKNDNSLAKEDVSKPKNYFELLMSKNNKKNGVINNSKEGSRVSSNDDQESLKKRKQKSSAKCKSPVIQTVNTKGKEGIFNSEPSENENILHFESKNNVDEVIELESENKTCLTLNNEIEDIDVISIFDSPKVELAGKKKLSILNYFTKTENSAENNLNYQNLDSSLRQPKTSQSGKNNFQKNDVEKSSQNTAKKVLLNDVNKENVKLAPLFYKKEKIIDSAKQKARLDFLYRGSPTVIKKSENKAPENIVHFPKIPHVQQRNESLYWSLREICLPLPSVFQSQCIFNKTKKFSLEIKRSDVVNKVISDDKINCTKDLFCKMKCKYVELDLDSVIDGLKDKRDKFLAQLKKIDNPKISSSKSSNEEMCLEELNALWTEKYKPKSSEILGNVNVVKKLKKWLQSWKTFDQELKVLAKNNPNWREKEDSDDDEDDFLDFGSDNYGLKAPGNVCIISGPNGCGKTTLVNALANELEFGVLELNASSKRTGKKVLTDLQEATQSHKVQRVNLLQNISLQAQKKKKNSSKVKKRQSVKPTDQTTDSKISLIVIEDADIVFEDHDEGFYSAIASLVQTSKRPLIFLINDPNCSYLENLKVDQCLILEMEPPNFYKSCAVLDVVSSLEGVQFEKGLLESLLRHNKFDLRKSLLELQFWTAPGSSIQTLQKEFDLGQLWWGLSQFLFKQDINHFVKPNARKRKRVNDLFDSSDDEMEVTVKKFKPDPEISANVHSRKPNTPLKTFDPSIKAYFSVLDLVSTLDGLCVTESEEPLPGYENLPKDSLVLDENMEEVFLNRNLTEQISNEMMNLSERIFLKQFKEEHNKDRKLDFTSPCWEEIRWRNSQEKASEELSSLVSLQRGRDKRSINLDYLPILRNICRIERRRSEVNPKRKNRFYHYLNNFGQEFSEENLEVNCDVFDR